eukprot:TRINITY_DN6841_c0_g3_i2.p1 TRINITY_DN6841_c0_g3~~TRINITY_DN6841_c0_g3_i2.p1  ORF type:complete len:207 (+),score=32.17 TRINITY_DN6841_c0_g3_i2:50-622(+)
MGGQKSPTSFFLFCCFQPGSLENSFLDMPKALWKSASVTCSSSFVGFTCSLISAGKGLDCKISNENNFLSPAGVGLGVEATVVGATATAFVAAETATGLLERVVVVTGVGLEAVGLATVGVGVVVVFVGVVVGVAAGLGVLEVGVVVGVVTGFAVTGAGVVVVAAGLVTAGVVVVDDLVDDGVVVARTLR